MTFTQCTFSENTCIERSGIYLWRDSDTLTVERSIVAFGRGGPAFSITSGAIDFSCSDIFGNEGGDTLSSGTVDTGGNFSLDPRYCGPLGEHIYTLQDLSPCAPGNHPDGHSCGRIGSRAVRCGAVPVRRGTPGGVKALFER